MATHSTFEQFRVTTANSAASMFQCATNRYQHFSSVRCSLCYRVCSHVILKRCWKWFLSARRHRQRAMSLLNATSNSDRRSSVGEIEGKKERKKKKLGMISFISY